MTTSTASFPAFARFFAFVLRRSSFAPDANSGTKKRFARSAKANGRGYAAGSGCTQSAPIGSPFEKSRFA